MTQLSDLSTHIEKENAEEFLKNYLLLKYSGFGLRLPKDTKRPAIQESWEKIAAKYHSNFTDDFIEALTEKWIQTIKAQGAKLRDTFVEELLTILNNGETPEPLKSKPTPSQKKNISPLIPDSFEAKEPLNQVKTEISSHYYHHEAAGNGEIPDQKENDALLKTALKTESPLDFLSTHLSKLHFGEKPQTPKSSLKKLIHDGWQDILLLNYNHDASPEFLNALCALWYPQIQKSGLPKSPEETLMILNALNP